MGLISRLLQDDPDHYENIDFNTDTIFNKPAPDPIVSFAIGGFLSACGMVMWLFRVRALKTKMANRDPPLILSGSMLLRAYLSCATDTDSPAYVMVSFGAASFLFLAGVQLAYKWTLMAMFIVYNVSALGETMLVLLAYWSSHSLSDLVVTTGYVASQLRGASAVLSPTSVYEDVARGNTIVIMVFITQVILISFVCLDIFNGETNNCLDGTKDCPIARTFGSWGFYVLGIFMSCVFILGPRTKFGESEQNPAYWLQLLLATKQTGAKITWYDPVKDKTKERFLHEGDMRIWVRFWLSYVVNGVGFHILVHALPIQVAAQSSFTGVVLRAVGMMYLVDLDDTPGYKLTIVPKADEELKVEEAATKEEEDFPLWETANVAASPKEVNEEVGGASRQGATTDPAVAISPVELSEEAKLIIEEARQKLDALARGEYPAGGMRVTNEDVILVDDTEVDEVSGC